MADAGPFGEHGTWFRLLPGLENVEKAVAHSLGRSFLDKDEIHALPHVIMTIFVMGILLYVGTRYRAHLKAAGDGGVVPESRLNARSFVEIISEAALGMMGGVMGRDAAKFFFPLIGTLAIFILVSNLLGLVPGFVPATDNLNTTFALGMVVFVVTHAYGIKTHGVGHYVAHFMGPMPLLAPLMFPIEIVSHIVRPVSLGVRLMGNMFADHMVLGIFIGLTTVTAFVVPVPVMLLGVLVCVVQALVFCLLSVVYIGLAIEKSEEAHH